MILVKEISEYLSIGIRHLRRKNPKAYHSKKVSIKLDNLGIHMVIIPTVAIGMAMWPTFSSHLDLMQTDPGDTLFCLYILEHVYQHFSKLHLINPELFWSPNYFWPIKDTLAWSENLLGPGSIYSLFRPFLDPYKSYIGWLGVTLWLNYASIRLAVQKISPETNSTWLSIAALTTAFSPAIMQQLGHPQLLSLFLIGPILYQCHKMISQPVEAFTVRNWITLASLLLANGFFNIYIFVYACYGALVCFGLHIYKRLQSKAFKVIIGGKLLLPLILLFIFIAINLYIYMPYLQTMKTFGARSSEDIINNLPKIASWLFGSDFLLLKSPLNTSNIHSSWVYGFEQELFPGWVLILLVSGSFLTAFYKRKTDKAGLRQWLLVIFLMMILSLSFNQISPWTLISKLLPGANALRASSRVGMIIILFCAPAVALSAKYWQPVLTKSNNFVASIIAISGSFASVWATGQSSFSLSEWREEVLLISQALSKKNCNVFWYQWNNQPSWRAHVLAMHVQRESGIPTANGYSGQFPRENWPFENPSGEGAFTWILDNSTSEHHSTRLLSEKKKWCIASLTQNKQVVVSESAKLIPASTIIYSDEAIQIKDKLGELYLRQKYSSNPMKWIPLTRDGNSIPSKRGDFKITKASSSIESKVDIILITDENLIQSVEFTWIINSKTGEFLGQTFHRLASQ